MFYGERSGGIRTYLEAKADFAARTGRFEHHLVIPGKTTGDHREANIVALRTAANDQLTTFLNQNYRTTQANMNKLIELCWKTAIGAANCGR